MNKKIQNVKEVSASHLKTGDKVTRGKNNLFVTKITKIDERHFKINICGIICECEASEIFFVKV